MKKLGIIGGVGPMATALFLKMIVEMTDAAIDQEHIEIVINHCPQIPDRTGYIVGRSKESPLPRLKEELAKLEAAGVEYVAIPCVTSTFFYKDMAAGMNVPLLNIIDELYDYLTGHGVKHVGLMATSGTIASGLFQQKFSTPDCELILPSKERQDDVMHLIYDNVKAGVPTEMDVFDRVKKELFDNGAEVIILGCTELSVIRENERIGHGFIDAMQLMAQVAIKECGKLKEEYRELIS